MNRGDDEKSLLEMNLEVIETAIPVHNDDLYVSKIFSLVKKTAEKHGYDEAWYEMERDIDARLNRIVEILDDYEKMEDQEETAEMHNALLSGFSLYYDGLTRLKEYMYEENDRQILDAFDLIFQGDQFVLKAEREIRIGIEENQVIGLI